MYSINSQIIAIDSSTIVAVVWTRIKMKYLIVATFTLIVPTTFARPQAPAQAAPQLQSAPQQHSGGPSTPVTIVSQTEVIGPDGSFNYSYDTSNGIHVEQGGYVKKAAESRAIDPNNPNQESGDIQVIQGAFSYTAPDGQQISLRYLADENGFQPEGEHLPKAPAVPEGIARSLGQQQQQPIGQQPKQPVAQQPPQPVAPQPQQPQTAAPAGANPSQPL